MATPISEERREELRKKFAEMGIGISPEEEEARANAKADDKADKKSKKDK